MTAFTNINLQLDGMYLTYNGSRFVARFKRGGAASFRTFLIKNFTVEEYFAQMEAGVPPLTIAESKGYVLPHIKKWLKQFGYPVTVEGFKQMSRDNAETARVHAMIGTRA